ncbi:MAG: FHA domain-containing protein [Anaerolineae bacterium]|nr:FHA domain-containing protein [Anaerolineae bacterium]
MAFCMNGFMHLERWIEQLVEEPFVRLFAGRLFPHDVVRHLVDALEDGERVGADGAMEVPGRYTVELNPDDLIALRRHHPDLDERLREALEALVARIALRTHEPPAVLLRANKYLPPRAVDIRPADRPGRQSAGQTHVPDATQEIGPSRLRQTLERPSDEPTPRAYLIVMGDRTFDLLTPIVRIGRAFDNDLILEDRQVSRYHAQLRRRYQRYILQDLGSTGGTTVNGFFVHEIVLRPGDLISLSGVDLIYAESEPLERSQAGHTQPLVPHLE